MIFKFLCLWHQLKAELVEKTNTTLEILEKQPKISADGVSGHNDKFYVDEDEIEFFDISHRSNNPRDHINNEKHISYKEKYTNIK